jgi:hypothetical protein
MTTHDIPNRRRRAAFVVGASVALGLAAAVGLQWTDSAPAPIAAAADRLDCPAVIAL